MEVMDMGRWKSDNHQSKPCIVTNTETPQKKGNHFYLRKSDHYENALTYLDHAATSYPKPYAVGCAMASALTDAGGNPGRSSHVLSMRAAELIFHTREHAAAFFGAAEPENVLFYPNATYAINTVLHSFGKRNLIKKETASSKKAEPISDAQKAHLPHILISEMEHNAVLRPLYEMEQHGEVVWEVYPVFRGAAEMLSEAEILANIKSRIRPETVLVCACHVSNVCAAMLPIDKIGSLCREMHVPLLVDASQSAGIYDIDIQRDHIDYLCTAGHKALLGPAGSGLLLIGEDAPRLYSLVQGGNGVESLRAAMPDFLPEMLEAGTLATPVIAGLDAGMRCLSSIGLECVRGDSHRLYRRLREMLLSMRGITVCQPGLETGTTLSFCVDGISCMQVSAFLSEYGICTRSGFHCAPMPHRAFGTEQDGTVRISVGFGNTVQDTERFYRVMKAGMHEWGKLF